VKKEKRIVCARWYELLKPEGGIMISLWTAWRWLASILAGKIIFSVLASVLVWQNGIGTHPFQSSRATEAERIFTRVLCVAWLQL
jgi:hypothetical protein